MIPNTSMASTTLISVIMGDHTLPYLTPQKMGILALLDEESRFPKGTDDTFMLKVIQTHAKSERFGVNKLTKTAFNVVHYAGAVTYDTSGFLEKNRDKFSDDLMELMQDSTNPLVAALFESDSLTSGRCIY